MVSSSEKKHECPHTPALANSLTPQNLGTTHDRHSSPQTSSHIPSIQHKHQQPWARQKRPESSPKRSASSGSATLACTLLFPHSSSPLTFHPQQAKPKARRGGSKSYGKRCARAPSVSASFTAPCVCVGRLTTTKAARTVPPLLLLQSCAARPVSDSD